ncbi:hypothetical protein KR093_011339, partial [Drosophila rubida]
DLTTVLLVNNDGAGRLGDVHAHGRYLSVRPELGLLTSTARTFIQEGITTEYATQVLGTTLDNGRLYAQYLKKSSRVLFENGYAPSLSSSPTVLTSWVGEGDIVHSHTRSYIQSHNDLFNADAPDWRDIDDNLDVITSGPVVIPAEFVGNTDFPNIKESHQVSKLTEIEPAVTLMSKEISGSAKQSPQANYSALKQLGEKWTIHKVLPFGDLPTFTVKNHFEPSGYHTNHGFNFDINANADIDAEERRSAKEYYYQQQQSLQLKNNEQRFLNLTKRLLSTVTYYGFADFTTVVGDSVIVFSPSSSQPMSLLGHVTTIKGMATLRTTPVEDKQFTLNTATSEAVGVSVMSVSDTSVITESAKLNSNTLKSTETIVDIDEVHINMTPFRSGLEISSNSTFDLGQLLSENVSSQPPNAVESSMGKSTLSLPTDQEILEIYASLSKAQVKEHSNISSTLSSQSNLNGHGGATTIFVDDDPFANFKEPTIILTSNTVTNTINNVEITTSHFLVEAKEIQEQIFEETKRSTPSTIDLATELMFESTQLPPLSHGFDNLHCDQRSSQIFLTQLPKLITILKTHIQDMSTVIDSSYSSSYDIKETTKYYCIPESTSRTELATMATDSKLNSVLEVMAEVETENVKKTNEMEQTEGITKESTSEETPVILESTTENSNAYDDYVTESEDYDIESDFENGQNEVDVIFKTLFTTYTYLTTFFEGESTAVTSHTEVVTNVITSVVGSSTQQEESTSTTIETDSSTSVTTKIAPTVHSIYIIQNEFDKLLHPSADDMTTNLEELNQITLQLDDAKSTKTFYTTYTYYTTIFANNTTEIMSRTEVFTNYVSKLLTESGPTMDVAMDTLSTTAPILTASKAATFSDSFYNNKAAEVVEDKEEKEHENVKLVTDVRSSSSSGSKKQVIGKLFVNKDQIIEDQVSSESNTEEFIPSETLLLQTSFTTFTFYTTMYVSDVTNVVSRLETVTNIATETVQPTKMLQRQGQEDASTLPITYFTTFTYWTKLSKDGEITTISREETISNVIEPTKQQTTESHANLTATNSITGTATALIAASESNTNVPSGDAEAITTFYTTFTYYTTSYEANNTVTDSRLETITNIIRPTAEFSDSDFTLKETSILPTTSKSLLGADVSTRKVSSLILYDYKHIIDADSVSTLYFTTKVYESINENGSPVELTSTISKLHVDDVKKMELATSGSSDDDAVSSRQYKTGLVRLIEGTRIGNSTTTLYQSKVIGTIIDNRYAQIIESTSSFLFESQIEPSVTSTLMDTFAVSTIQSFPPSLVDLHHSMIYRHDSTEVNLEEEEPNDNTAITNDDDQVEYENSIDIDSNISKAQTQEKKRTFAPVIRPFASRNRPINRFAPKQKTQSASSATIITRLDITPTITATPALKSVGRFGSSRKASISNAPNILTTTSRRLFGRPIKASNGAVSQITSSNFRASSSFSTSSRNRFVSSLRTALTSTSSKRLSSSYRNPSSSNNYRISALNRIKPTPIINPSLTKSSVDMTSDAQLEDDGSSTEETNAEVYVNVEDNAKANENSRRQQNPLLRFRRPLGRPNGFTTITSARRNPFSGPTKSSTETIATTTTKTSTAKPRPRSFQRPTISNLQTSTRFPNKLFPPRGFFQKKQLKPDETGSNLNENDDTEYDDNDEETDSYADSDEAGVDNDNDRLRRSHPNNRTLFRVRRQTSDALSRSRFRFRRPKTATTEEPAQSLGNDEITEGTTTSASPRLKQNARYGSRFQTHSQQSIPTSTQPSLPLTHRGPIRPTRPTTTRMQFTLREKDTTTMKNNARQGNSQLTTSSFRRHQHPPATSQRRITTNSSHNSRRLKTYSNHNHNSNHNVVDVSNQRATGASRSRNANRGRSSSMRGRASNRNEDTSSTDLGSVTITVTHLIPAEVTIPVINGQVTEFKNIVTGKPSLEVLAPHQYTQILGNNGQISLYLTREDSNINSVGVTELTRYLLHDTMTTTVTFTPTTIRGRKTSFSHVLPSTVYSVENVVTTLQPQISANAPLANILLSQLLLGNINLPANQLLGVLGQPAQGSLLATGLPLEPAPALQPLPQTEYRTHTSTYVTTIYDGKSTILPITFQGKKILTTVFDTTAQTITATEYSIDTIINTPTIQQQFLQQQPQVNSLLLQQFLLQQQQQQQPLQIQHPISNTVMPQIYLGDHLQDLDGVDDLADAVSHMRDNIDDIIITEHDADRKNSRKKSRKSGKSSKLQKTKSADVEKVDDRSVITLYVSGRRPGEFSTILSTVYNEHPSNLQKRHVQQTAALYRADDFTKYGASEQNEIIININNSELHKNALGKDARLNECLSNTCLLWNINSQTTSLESIVGDVDSWYTAKSKKQAQTLTVTTQSSRK